MSPIKPKFRWSTKILAVVIGIAVFYVPFYILHLLTHSDPALPFGVYHWWKPPFVITALIWSIADLLAIIHFWSDGDWAFLDGEASGEP